MLLVNMGAQNVVPRQPLPPEAHGGGVSWAVEETADRETAVWVTVWRSMNDHGGMTVYVPESHEFRQVVEYDSTELRRLLGRLPAGASVRTRLERLRGRGDAWRLAAVY
jgi:hypothetical protein